MRGPDLRRCVGVCTTCRHWQVDIRAAAISDLGGFTEAVKAIAEEHNGHRAECPGAGGRIKIFGRWQEPPKMSDGHRPDGMLEFHPLPAWWVAR